jgi:hypothetical protein
MRRTTLRALGVNVVHGTKILPIGCDLEGIKSNDGAVHPLSWQLPNIETKFERCSRLVCTGSCVLLATPLTRRLTQNGKKDYHSISDERHHAAEIP